jgi:hypothetical protein
MIDTIICEVSTIIYGIGIINVRFYLLKIWYPHGYGRITLFAIFFRVCFLKIKIFF